MLEFITKSICSQEELEPNGLDPCWKLKLNLYAHKEALRPNEKAKLRTVFKRDQITLPHTDLHYKKGSKLFFKTKHREFGYKQTIIS